MKRLTLCVALAAIWVTAGTAQAGLRNDVPSCYAANNIRPADGRGYNRLLYVLIDQTVGWSRDPESSIMDSLNDNLAPGTKFVIAQFSAFAQGRYLQVIHTGIIEAPLPASQIGGTPIQAAKLFNACRADQQHFAVAMADDATIAALQGSNSSLARSDIMSALDQVSGAIAADPASQKLLLLASDGLENSAAASFYRQGRLRDIDPAAELQRAKAAGLVGDFSGARVYIIGGAGGSSEAYRPPLLLKRLAMFWAAYFRAANATLVEFGEPALLEPVHF